MAGVGSWCKLEDAKAEADVGVSDIVVAFAEGVAHGADIVAGGGSIRSWLDFVPEAVEIAAGCVIVPEVVGGVRDPEGGN